MTPKFPKPDECSQEPPTEPTRYAREEDLSRLLDLLLRFTDSFLALKGRVARLEGEVAELRKEVKDAEPDFHPLKSQEVE